MKILVTGGAGYIGSHTVVELAAAGFEPIIVDDFRNSSPAVLEGISALTGRAITHYDLDCASANLEDVFRTEKNIAGAIHFAAYKAVGESGEKPLDYYENNVMSTVRLLRLLVAYNAPLFVFSSSATVYGQPTVLPVTEETPCQRAESVYGRTKQICEDVILDTQKSGAAIKPVLLRYFNPVGAHPSARIGELPLGVPNNLIPFVTQTAAGIREVLTVFGNDYATEDGSAIRDYIHVVDLAKAHVSALSYLKHGGQRSVFNIGTGHGNSVLEVLRTFEEVNGIKVPYRIGARRPGDIEKIWADCSLAEREMGWKAGLSLADALRDSWRWQKTLGNL